MDFLTPSQWAIFLKPFAAVVLFLLIVYPLRNVLAKLIPNGRVRAFLFRERTRDSATDDDRRIMIAAVVIFYVVFLAIILAVT